MSSSEGSDTVQGCWPPGTPRAASYCQGKTAYAGKRQAIEQIKRYAKRGKMTRGGINAYRCEYCNHWHVGRANPLPLRRR